MLREWRRAGLRGVFGLLDSLCILERAQPWLSGLGLVMMFHRVVSPGTPIFDPRLAIHANSLDLILGYVRRRGFEIVSADQLHSRTNGTHRRPFVCFTFDDGYVDNLTLALPIFRRHQAPFCVYTTVGYVDRTTPAWWDALGSLLLERDEIERGDGGAAGTIPLRTWKEKVEAYHHLGSSIYRDVLAGRPPLGDGWLRNGVDPLALSDPYFMTWSELKQLAEDPLVQIGAHTLTHPSLAQLPAHEAGYEIEKSKRVLEGNLGIEVRHFAYPFGGTANCGIREFRLAEQAGFKTAVTTRCCNIFPTHAQHLLSLPRKSVSAADAGVGGIRALLYGEDLSLKPSRRVVVA